MKIYVNEMPVTPKDCLFANKIKSTTIDKDTWDPSPIDLYNCNINMKRCNIDCGGKCNKLRVPDFEV